MVFRKQKYTQFRERKIPRAPGVYKISINNKVRYVGLAIDLRKRYAQHLQSTEHNLELYNKMQGISKKEFEFLVVHEQGMLAGVEKKEIKKYGAQLYNINHNKGE
jgi:excinuclease UvrABC nuclease subunit